MPCRGLANRTLIAMQKCMAQALGRRLQATQPVALIQAAAPRTTREDFICDIFKFAAARTAAVDILERLPLPALATPFKNEPRAKNAGQHTTQADEDEDAERCTDHGRGFPAESVFAGLGPA